MLGICLTCGHDSDDIEAHHVAGEANNATLTVPVCGPCHRVLTSWQLAAGVELAHEAPRTDTDEMRGLAGGLFDLFRLAAQRHPDRSWIGAPLATLTGRAFSRRLDLAAPADRPGRWLPDPTQPPIEALPVAALEQTELDVVVLYATLVADFLSLVGDDRDQVAVDLLRTIAGDAGGFHRAWQTLQAEPPRAVELGADLQGQLEACERAIGALLVADPDAELDSRTLDDLRSWVQAGQRLTELLAALTYQSARTTP